jgi:hypothetical protein
MGRCGRAPRGRVAVVGLALLFMLLLAAPPAAADGMPVVTTVTIGPDPPEKVFSSIFESRQLAEVDLLNDSHERINLFLSVYSLDPGKNMSIVVPLRTMPAYVSGTPMKESDFRAEYNLDRTEDEVDRQDMDAAWDGLGDAVDGAWEAAFGSLVCSLPGEVLREESPADLDGTPEFMLGGGMLSAGGYDSAGPDEVAHYEFDGFSVDVLHVGAGGTLADYLALEGRVVPEGMPVDRYDDDYVAVIEAETKPPIPQEEFDALREAAPVSIEYLINNTKQYPTLDGAGRELLKERLWRNWYSTSHSPEYLYAYAVRLVDAIYGDMDFQGEVVSIDLPLEDGKVFFPLGTSEGWPTKVGDIAVLFKVPEDRGLDIQGAEDVYFGGSHWYLFQMEDSNPGFDLESAVTGADSEARALKERAAFINDNAPVFAVLLVSAVILALWIMAILVADRYLGRKGKVLRSPSTWLLLGAALLISVPGALLAWMLWRPVPIGTLLQSRVAVAAMALLPCAAMMLVAGVAV